MSEIFAAADEVTGAFLSGISAGVLAVLVMACVLLAGLWDAHRRLYIKSVTVFALAAIVCVAVAVYLITFDRFVEVRKVGPVLELHYAGPFAHKVFVERDSIDTVLFGTTGKSPRPCYIRIVLKSQQSYRSASMDADVATCKRIRGEMLEGAG